MAKLEGVKVLDMTKGKTTKVSFNGAEYTKADEKAKQGDIVHSSGVMDAAKGNFYEVNAKEGMFDSGASIIDDVGDKRSNLGSFTVFRKQPTYSKIDDIEDAQAGDFIKFDVDMTSLTKGHYYEIVSFDGWGDPEIYDDDSDLIDIMLDDEDLAVYRKVEPKQDEKEAEAKPGEIKAGSKVRVVAPFMTGGQYKKGDVLTVKNVRSSGHIIDVEGVRIALGAREVELVDDTIKAGDTVKFILPEGESARYGRAGVPMGAIGTVESVHDDRVLVFFDEFCRGRLTFAADISELAKVEKAEEPTPESREFQNGDIVRVTNGGGTILQNGEIGEVADKASNRSFRVNTESITYANWVSADCVELIVAAENRADKQ